MAPLDIAGFKQWAACHWENTNEGRIGTPILHVFCVKRWMDGNGNSKAKLKFAIDSDKGPYNVIYSQRNNAGILRLLYCTELVQESSRWMRRCKSEREAIVFIGDGWPVVMNTIKSNFKEKYGVEVHIEFHTHKLVGV